MEIAQSAHFPSSDPKLLWVDTGRFVPPVRQALCHQCRMAPQRHFLLFCTASGLPSKQPSSLTSDSASQSSSFKAQPPLQARRFEWQYSEQVVFASISATTVQASLEHHVLLVHVLRDVSFRRKHTTPLIDLVGEML